MFKHTLTRTFLAAGLAAILLVPAAQAAERGGAIQLQELDPAIATAIRDRASLEQRRVALDPAIRTALADREPASAPVVMTALADRTPRAAAPLDPAIRTALADREPASAPVVMTALADRTPRDLASPVQAAATDSRGFDWNAVGIGTGAGLLVLLLGLGSLMGVRHGRMRGSSA